MNDRDAMIEAVAVALSMADPDGRALPEGAPMNRFYRMLANTALEAAEPFITAREQAAREEDAAEKYRIFTDGLEAAAQICGSLAETTYDDADAFNAATGCEAAIMKVVREQRKEQDAIERNEHREQQDG